MKINVNQLSPSQLRTRIDWLTEHIGERKYYLHNQIGGEGWRYFSQIFSIEIDDEQWATLFILKFGI